MSRIKCFYIIMIFAIGMGGINLSPTQNVKENLTPLSSAESFSPTIDGLFSSSDRWELAENAHLAFVHSDVGYKDNYNYLYTSRAGGRLYVMVDLCSETSNDIDEDDWIALWLDTDYSRQINPFLIMPFSPVGNSSLLYEYYYNLDLYRDWVIENLTSPISGLKGIFYNMSNSAKNLTFTFSARTGDQELLNSSANYTIATGFGVSPNCNIAHRIFEFNISMSDLGLSDTENYGILVQEHGSTSFSTSSASPNKIKVNTLGFYCLGIGSQAVYSAQLVAWYAYVLNEHMLGNDDKTGLTFPNVYTTSYAVFLTASMERYFFPCGSAAKGVYDLLSNPRLYLTADATDVKFSPVMNNQFSATEYWELAENIQAGFMETDEEHLDNYNYIYTGRQDGQLYVLVDKCSDITNDPEAGEWISLWFTKNLAAYQNMPDLINNTIDNAYDDIMKELQLNLNATYESNYYNLTFGDELEGVFYNVSSGEHNLSFDLPDGSTSLDSTTSFTVSYGFGVTPNSNIPHAFYKFKIPLSELNLGANEDFRMSVMGYGTEATPTWGRNSTDPKFYAITPTSGAEFVTQILNYVYLMGLNGGDGDLIGLPCAQTTAATLYFFGMNPRFYFPFGTSSDILDLKDNALFYTLDNHIPENETPLKDEATEEESPTVGGYPILGILGICAIAFSLLPRGIKRQVC